MATTAQPLPAFAPTAKRRVVEETWSKETALDRIMFVLHIGIAVNDLSQLLGYGSGMTCWRRLHDWKRVKLRRKLHYALSERLRNGQGQREPHMH